jgi:hypothetical protein
MIHAPDKDGPRQTVLIQFQRRCDRRPIEIVAMALSRCNACSAGIVNRGNHKAADTTIFGRCDNRQLVQINGRVRQVKEKLDYGTLMFEQRSYGKSSVRSVRAAWSHLSRHTSRWLQLEVNDSL